MPALSIDLEAITTHLDALADIQPCPRCDIPVTTAMADIGHLLIQITVLYAALQSARLQSANRLAAIRAALHAYDDGEDDPLAYLRDELTGTDTGSGADGTRRR